MRRSLALKESPDVIKSLLVYSGRCLAVDMQDIDTWKPMEVAPLIPVTNIHVYLPYLKLSYFRLQP